MDDITRELVELETRYWSAIQERDVDAALRLTTDPCVVAGSSGAMRVDHATFRQIMSGATYTLHGFELAGDPVAQQLTSDCAALAYTVREHLTVDGERLTLEAADTSVWVRKDGTWKCAMHTESVLGDAYGRDRVRGRETAGSR